MLAFSEDQLSRIVVPLLFALFGGSITAFGKDLAERQRRDAYSGLCGLALFCTLGIVIGVLAVQFRWLSPASAATGNARSYLYLRSQITDAVSAIQMQVDQGRLRKDEAYDRIIEAVTPKEGR
jgi:hypothetical protein